MRGRNSFIEGCIPYNGVGHHWPQALAVFSSAIGSFNTGSLTAWTSPSIPILISNGSHTDPITLNEASYFTVLPPLFCILLSPIASMLVDGIGRQKTIMIMAAAYFASWITLAFAHSLTAFYIGRSIQGLGDAILFTAVPMYIGEISEPAVRASWGNLIAIFGFSGQFVINAIGSYCSIQTTALILSCIPLVQLFLMTLMPESPYYLIMKKNEEKARTSLKILRWKSNVDEEYRSLNKDVQRQISESGTLKDVFMIPTNRKAVIIGIGIRASQQLSGLPVFFMYTQYMFLQAGSDISASIAAITFSGVFMVMIGGFGLLIHRFGRRPLMILSCFGCGVVLTIEASYFYIHQMTTVDVSHLSWIPLAGMLMYVPVCGIGLGIIPTLMLGELFSASVKGKAMGLLNICFSVFIIAGSKLFQILSVNFGMYAPFCFFAISCFAGTVFSYCCVPETKGKTLEEIQQSLRGANVETKTIQHMNSKC